jgi:hypothetical protein
MKNTTMGHDGRLLFYSLIVASVVFLVIATYFGPSLTQLKQAIVGEELPACSTLPNNTAMHGKESQLKILADQVTQTTGGVGFAEFDTERCPGKVELFIGYGSESNKPTLVKLWQASPLKNIPVHWKNS